MRDKAATADAAIANIAARQHGVVSARQLLDAGLTRNAISRRVKKGWLHRVHQGVYAVGHPALSREERWMAAVLACGGEMAARERSTAGTAASVASPRRRAARRRNVALSHRSAAELWGLLRARSGPIDVSIASDSGREKRKGIRIHRSTSLTSALTTRQKGIPVTTPARTIADLRRATPRGGPRRAGPTKPGRGAVSPKELRRAIRQADALGLPIGTEAVPDRTRSDLERLFLRLCRRHGLPPPEVNVRIGSMEVDFLWRDRRLVVETDGYKYHRSRAAFEDDRDRDLKLRALGYEVVRLSDRQVADDPERVAAMLSECLPAH